MAEGEFNYDKHQAMASRYAQLAPFLEQHPGKLSRASNVREMLRKQNEKLVGAGYDPVSELKTLSPEQLSQEWLRFAGKGPKQASQAAVFRQREAEDEETVRRDEGLSSLDQFEAAFRSDPRREALWAMIQSNLANPERLDAKFKAAEGNIRSRSASASRAFEDRARFSLGGRGLPGSPFKSGVGARSVGRFEAENTRGMEQNLRSNEIARIIAAEQLRAQGMGSASAFLGGEYGTRMGLQSNRTALTSRNPMVLSDQGMGNYGNVLMQLQAMEEAGDQSFLDQYGPLIEGTLGAVGTFAGGPLAGQLLGTAGKVAIDEAEK